MLADGELRHPSLNDHIVCKRCGKIFESINKTRKYCSYDCRIEAQVEAGRARFGADTDRIVKSDWLTVLKRWRMDIISRDRYKCVHCGSTNSLTVHNIRHPVGYQGYHLGSGVTLCRDCLTAITGFEKDHEEELMKIAEERDDRQR